MWITSGRKKERIIPSGYMRGGQKEQTKLKTTGHRGSLHRQKIILVPSIFSAEQIYAKVSESRAEGKVKPNCLQGKANCRIKHLFASYKQWIQHAGARQKLLSPLSCAHSERLNTQPGNICLQYSWEGYGRDLWRRCCTTVCRLACRLMLADWFHSVTVCQQRNQS